MRALIGVLILAAGVGAFVKLRPLLWSVEEEAYLTCESHTGEFNFDITERGELESSASTEVRCEVESTDRNGTKILEIIPEGTTVKQKDQLIRFDDSGLRSNRVLQEIALNTARAAVTQAKNEVESAEFAKREYELGTFPQEEQKAESELFAAKETLQRAEESLEYKRQMARKGFADLVAVDAQFVTVGKHRRELAVAETKLMVLRDYTKVKTLRKHEADIDTAKAKLASEEAKLNLENEKLARIDEQIGKCTVLAPCAGQVIYDHSQDRWGGDEGIIKEGAFVYERRIVIQIPDPAKMRVKAKIPEARIDRLKTGMSATIEVEGLPGVKLQGVVTKVNSFPAEGNWYNSSVKEYETTIDIPTPPPGLRPGMTAQVSIRAEHLDSALQVPLQAVVEVNEGHYCLQRGDAGELVPRPVRLGSANEKHLVIEEGLASGAVLLLDPRSRLTAWKDLPAPLAVVKKPDTAAPAAKPDSTPTTPATTGSAAQPEVAQSTTTPAASAAPAN